MPPPAPSRQCFYDTVVLATADPDLLSNDDDRSALAAWPAVIDQLWQEEIRARRLVDEEIAPFLTERGDLLATLRTTDGFTSAGLDQVVALRAAADSANRNALILRDGRFLNLVAWKVRAEREALYKHEHVSAAYKALLNLLETEIARRRYGGPPPSLVRRTAGRLARRSRGAAGRQTTHAAVAA